MAEKAFLYIVMVILYCAITPVMTSRNIQYLNNAGLSGKKCPSTELVITETTNSVLQCTTVCQATAGCTSAFYNHVTGTCYGCNGYYDVDTTIVIDESDTTYHYIACPDGWPRRGNSCYLLNQDKLDWVNARIYCQTKNAYLVEINDEEENTFIQTMNAEGPNRDIWLVLNDKASENTFRWEGSNASLTYRRWYPNEPSGSTAENCIYAFPNDGRWNDARCSGFKYYMCEKAVKVEN